MLNRFACTRRFVSNASQEVERSVRIFGRLGALPEHFECKPFNVGSATTASKLSGAILNFSDTMPDHDNQLPLFRFQAASQDAVKAAVTSLIFSNRMLQNLDKKYQFEYEVVQGKSDKEIPVGQTPLHFWIPVYRASSPLPSLPGRTLRISSESHTPTVAQALQQEINAQGEALFEVMGSKNVLKAIDAIARGAKLVRHFNGERLRCSVSQRKGKDKDNKDVTLTQLYVRSLGCKYGSRMLRTLPSVDQVECKNHMMVGSTTALKSLVGYVLENTRLQTSGCAMVMHTMGVGSVGRAVQVIMNVSMELEKKGICVDVEVSGSGYDNERNKDALWLNVYFSKASEAAVDVDPVFKVGKDTTFQKLSMAATNVLNEKGALTFNAIGMEPLFKVVDLIAVLSKKQRESNQVLRSRFSLKEIQGKKDSTDKAFTYVIHTSPAAAHAKVLDNLVAGPQRDSTRQERKQEKMQTRQQEEAQTRQQKKVQTRQMREESKPQDADIQAQVQEKKIESHRIRQLRMARQSSRTQVDSTREVVEEDFFVEPSKEPKIERTDNGVTVINF